MPQRRNVVEAVATIGLLSALAGCAAGCGSSQTTTTVPPTTTTPPTTTLISETTTTIAEIGPQPLPLSGFAEPGDYVTTVFEPTVAYRIETNRILGAVDTEEVAGFENRFPRPERVALGLGPYRGITIHNHWLGLTGEELIAELEEIPRLSLGPTSPVAVGGFPGTQIEATVGANAILWTEMGSIADPRQAYLESGQQMRLIVVDTPAGSLLISIGADAEEWGEFLPVAEEILAGMSFPDLD